LSEPALAVCVLPAAVKTKLKRFVRIDNINLSDIQVSAVQIGGATFKHIGPPPDKDGGDDTLAKLVLKAGKVAGFWLQ
jgi:hypothetical protein